ncbi:MAG TPA: non-homologous end-joining DNA ligase [Candidatus Methylacidiphilales bacterium]
MATRAAQGTTLDIGGTKVPVSNLDKVYYPEAKFTKGDVIDYYVRVSPVLLPHLKGRPLTMKRYPNGVAAPFFYEKQCPRPTPPFVETCRVKRRSRPGEIRFCVVDNLPTLVWAANLGDLELHTFLSRAPKIDRPTQVVFDLDPGPPAGIVDCARVALLLRGMFESLKLESFAKASGSKGLQVYVPLNTETDYEETSAFAKAVAQALEQSEPGLVVSDMKKRLRKGKVLVDWSQNSKSKTTVSVYSLRAKERPFVSLPLEWKEIEAAVRKKDGAALFFDAAAALKRIGKKGDLFEPVLTLKQDLGKAVKAFASRDAKEEPLRAYEAKRNFGATREPKGRRAKGKKGKLPLFVIQKHAASHLHYDFRLEVDGVLKSWAVPKGPPTDPKVRRLAMQVEDHPYDYATFEGTIPEGNYGAGTVMVWDIGTWENLGPEPREGLRTGKLHFRLSGKKLKGEWALVRMKGARYGKGNEWLLLRHGKAMKPISKRRDDTSALSRRSFKRIEAAPEAEWKSNR